MRTTITIDDGLLSEVRAAAGTSGRSVSAFIQDAVASALRREAGGTRPFRLVTFGGAGPWPAVDLDHTSALVEEDDVAAHGEPRGRP